MALYLKKTLENEAEIAVWKIEETEEELKALCSVPNDEMEIGRASCRERV